MKLSSDPLRPEGAWGNLGHAKCTSHYRHALQLKGVLVDLT